MWVLPDQRRCPQCCALFWSAGLNLTLGTCIFVLSLGQVDAILDHAPLDALDEAVFLFIGSGFVSWRTEAGKYGYHGKTTWSCLGSMRAPSSGDRQNWPSGISQPAFLTPCVSSGFEHMQDDHCTSSHAVSSSNAHVKAFKYYFDCLKNINNSSTKLHGSSIIFATLLR